MSSRALAALGLLIAASAAERFAYWGMRSSVMADLIGDKSVDSAQSMASLFVWLGVLGLVLGAGIAYVVGARVAAVAATVVAALGIFVLAAGLSPLAGAGIASLGAGMFRLCPYAAAVEIFTREDGESAAPSPRRFASLSAFATGVAVAIHIGSITAPSLRSGSRMVGRAFVYGVSGGVALLAAVLAAAAIFVAPSSRPQAPMPAQAPYREGPALAAVPHSSPSTTLPGVAILAAAGCLWWLGMSTSTPPPSIAHQATWLYSVSSLAAAAATTVAFVLWIAAATARWSGVPLLFYGVGLAVFGVGLGFVAIGSKEALIYAFGAMIAGVGEAAIPIGIAYAALSVRGRAVGIVLAGWLMTSTLCSRAGGALLRQPEIARTVELLFLCCVSIGAGALLATFARRMQRAFFDSPAPSPRR